MSFAPGQIARGGKHAYIEILNPDGTHASFLHLLDDHGNPVTFVTGVVFRPSTSDLFACGTPDLTLDYAPHDIDCFPNESGLLVAVVRASSTLEFWKYDFDGNVIQTWNPEPEYGWAKESTKISIACDNRTVFYTQSLRSIRRFDLQTGAQLPDYQTLPVDSPYIFGGIRTIPRSGAGDDLDVVVAMTLTGDGPRLALCLDADRSSFWTGEVNPSGPYHVFKRALIDRSLLLSVVTSDDPADDNDQTLSLACNYRPCLQERIWISSLH